MRKKFDYDYLVIGSGPAGKIGALMGASSGLKTAIVEARRWGGRNGGGKGVFEQAGIDCFSGKANFLDPHMVQCGEKKITANNFLIATGAEMLNPAIIGMDKVKFKIAEEAMRIEKKPRVVFVVGGGSAGCEIAQYYANLGAMVLVAEIAARLLPKEDEEIGKAIGMYFSRKLKINVLTRSRVFKLEEDKVSKKVFLLQDGKEKMARVDMVVMATGSAPAIDLGLDKAGVKVSSGKIDVTKYLQTSAKHIWAAGDVVENEGSSTEKAEYAGALATANMINRTKNPVNYQGFVRLTRTDPMLAAVGMNEDDCLKRDYKIKKVITPLSASRGAREIVAFGCVKLIADKQNRLLGATVIAPHADLMIQELAMAVRHGLTTAEIANTPHISGSIGEVIRIAARNI